MDASLEGKLAAMISHLEEVRAGRRTPDPKAFNSYLDDPEVAGWLDSMKARISGTRFITER